MSEPTLTSVPGRTQPIPSLEIRISADTIPARRSPGSTAGGSQLPTYGRCPAGRIAALCRSPPLCPPRRHAPRCRLFTPVAMETVASGPPARRHSCPRRA